MSKELSLPAPSVSNHAPILSVVAWRVRSFFTQKLYIGVFLPLIIFSFWYIATANEWIDHVFLPKPIDVVKSFWYMLWEQELLNDIWISVSIVSQGFIYGSLVAVFLGVLSGLSRKVELFFSSTLNTLRHIPSIAWLPLIVLWLGLGAPAKVLILAKAVFFPVFLNTLQGIRSIDKSYIELANVLTLTKWQLVRKVILPAILPSIAVSLRYSVGLSLALVVIAEGLSGQEGLGFLIFRAQQLLMADQLIVSMVLIGIIGFSIDRGLYLAQQRLLRWKVGFDA
ncbi:MAG: ABC transporter permease [Campylobacteraceae bacterium]|jgi:sulfonate transport system permease protein|nr:ABC transporter permease [Campylobacteraceae bacterium]